MQILNIKLKTLAFTLILACLTLCFHLQNSTAFQHEDEAFLQDFQLPASLSLCSESLPMTDPYVREMLDREFIISVWDRAQVFLWLKRAPRYFPVIEKKLAEAGMPDDLKYLAVAESSLLTHIRSGKGALGIWQFMPKTGRHNGLRKDRMVDERLNHEASTDAALKYLKQLNIRFGSWTLAMAAYNCGQSRLGKALKEQKVDCYYKLNLPIETERYIFRIAAIKIILENPTMYGYNLAPESTYPPIIADKVRIALSLPQHITGIAQKLGTEFKIIKELNPQFLGQYLPSGTYCIKVPAGLGGKMADIIKTINTTARRQMKHNPRNYYTVKYGDTLACIAQQTGTSISRIQQLNALRGSFILAGQKLRLYP